MKWLKIKRYKTLKIYLRMNVSVNIESSYKRSRKANINDCLSEEKLNRGINNAKETDKRLLLEVYKVVRRNIVTPDMLFSYFPDNSSLMRNGLLSLLEVIYVGSHRNKSYYGNLIGMGNKLCTQRLNDLISYGYISVTEMPRKIMLLDKYTMMKVYFITNKGKGILKSIYEDIGLV